MAESNQYKWNVSWRTQKHDRILILDSKDVHKQWLNILKRNMDIIIIIIIKITNYC